MSEVTDQEGSAGGGVAEVQPAPEPKSAPQRTEPDDGAGQGNRLERRNRELAQQVKALQEQLATSKEQHASEMQQEIARVAAEAEARESELRTQLNRLNVESQVLDAVRPDRRGVARTLLAGMERAEGLDLTADGAAEQAMAKLAEQLPDLYAQPPAAKKQGADLDVSGKTFRDLTPEERQIVASNPDLYRQMRAGQKRRVGI